MRNEKTNLLYRDVKSSVIATYINVECIHSLTDIALNMLHLGTIKSLMLGNAVSKADFYKLTKDIISGFSAGFIDEFAKAIQDVKKHIEMEEELRENNDLLLEQAIAQAGLQYVKAEKNLDDKLKEMQGYLKKERDSIKKQEEQMKDSDFLEQMASNNKLNFLARERLAFYELHRLEKSGNNRLEGLIMLRSNIVALNFTIGKYSKEGLRDLGEYLGRYGASMIIALDNTLTFSLFQSFIKDQINTPESLYHLSETFNKISLLKTVLDLSIESALSIKKAPLVITSAFVKGALDNFEEEKHSILYELIHSPDPINLRASLQIIADTPFIIKDKALNFLNTVKTEFKQEFTKLLKIDAETILKGSFAESLTHIADKKFMRDYDEITLDALGAISSAQSSVASSYRNTENFLKASCYTANNIISHIVYFNAEQLGLMASEVSIAVIDFAEKALETIKSLVVNNENELANAPALL